MFRIKIIKKKKSGAEDDKKSIHKYTGIQRQHPGDLNAHDAIILIPFSTSEHLDWNPLKVPSKQFYIS